MSTSEAIPPIEEQVSVPATRKEAFRSFTDGFGTWWPPAYTWAGDVLEEIAIEPEEGGRCFERGPHGFECDWGRVLVWEPPIRLAFSWQIAADRVPQPNPEKASEVDVRFEEVTSESTRVNLVHRAWERHGNDARGYRDGLGSERGWSYILDQYRRACVS